MNRQTALGDHDNPTPHTPDAIPAGCYWWTDPDGALCLLPGCWSRVADPDAECTCATLAARLAATERTLHELRRRQEYADRWHTALAEALDAHPAGRDIRTDAAARRDAARTTTHRRNP